MNNNEPWYSVKSVFKHTNLKSYEERIVIFLAKDIDEARSKGTEEANEYVESVGQIEFLKIIDIFHLFDEKIKDGIEVFSQITDSELSVDKFIERHYSTK